ncbi:hypothetical protein [Ewingella americana]|uniref:Uncharacterized protein n=1 Tax=Ewingella americana TaxID=41202 RepID=A0A502GL31_9GAMM|nr:hypothetical protein [Ewingella americana]TPG62574.1 hypothetical protein EAH77_08775 [Ewingella americana]
MTLLRNEYEYRTWMEREFFGIADDSLSVFEPDELERELLHQMPEQFPCIALIVKGPSPYEPEAVKFISRSQVEEWAKAMGMIN